MLRLPNIALPATAQSQLQRWQNEINALADHDERVKAAKQKFAQRNTKQNRTFAKVRATLTAMCFGACRCGYCEDSAADEVEHIKPKHHYPEEVFVWQNYLYACGVCNRLKNSHFAVFRADTGQREELAPPHVTPSPPPDGTAVFLDPRQESGLEFMMLDVTGTFLFLPIGNPLSPNYQRAEYTIDTLDLNRDVLLKARKDYYGHYRARLKEYVHQQENGASAEALAHLKTALQHLNHPTVWREMQRTQAKIPELAVLFQKVPEALTW